MGKFDINDLDYTQHPIFQRLWTVEGFTLLNKDEVQRVKEGEGLKMVLLLDDPNRMKECLDMAVIGPELAKALKNYTVTKYSVDFASSKATAASWGIRKLPSVAFFKGDIYVGALEGLKNWEDYMAELVEILARDKAPTRQIMMVNANAQDSGGCHH